VQRGENPPWYDAAYSYNLNKDDLYAKTLLESYGIHASEYSSIGLKHDFYIDNNGSVDELHKEVSSIIDL
jgi:hypothetical protein